MAVVLKCRICLSDDELQVSVFSAYAKKSNIYNKIKICLPIKIDKNDFLPKTICYECLKGINSFYDFFCKSISSEQILKNKPVPGKIIEKELMAKITYPQKQLINRISENVVSIDNYDENSNFVESEPSEIPSYYINTALETDITMEPIIVENEISVYSTIYILSFSIFIFITY